MKIVIETERTLHRAMGVDFHDPTVVQIRVKVDGEEDLSLAHVITVDEMRSNFDILWEYLGDKIKRAYAHRKSQELVSTD